MSKKIHWTEHSKLKMRQYGISKSKLMTLLYKPERKERGIVFGTTAMMQTNKSYAKTKNNVFGKKGRKAPGEIWLMYKDVNPSASSGQATRKIISAWRYPGISKPGESPPIPEDIRKELLKEN